MARAQATAARVGRLYRRGDTWWGDYRDAQGARHRHSLRTADVKVARERLREFELASPADRAANARTLEGALTHLLDTVYAGRPAGTLRCYRQKARHLVRLLDEHTPLAQVTRERVQQYRAARLAEGASANTIHKELVVLRRALAESGVTGVVPRHRAEYVPRKRFLTPAQFQAVMDALPAKRRFALVLWCYLGPRDSELVGLRREDVNTTEWTIRVRGTKTKGSNRFVPIHPAVRPWITAALEASKGEDGETPPGPLVEKWPHRHRALCHAWWTVNGLELPKRGESEAGRDRLSPNDLRRTFMSWMKQAGVDSLAVAQVAGTSTKMVELVYGQLTPETHRAAVAALPNALPGGCDAGVRPESARVARNDTSGTKGSPRKSWRRLQSRVRAEGLEPSTNGLRGPYLRLVTDDDDTENGQ